MASEQKHYKVRGMTCGSCEVLIERELKKIPEIRRSKVSHKDGKVTVYTKEGVQVDEQALHNAMKENGYEIEEWVESGPTKLEFKRIGGAALIVMALYIFLSKIGFLNYSPSTEIGSGLIGVFVIGVIAAFSSCTAVVTGLITAVSVKAAKSNVIQGFSKKMTPHLLFNFGRLLGFVGFGGVIGMLGRGLSLSPTANGILILGIAVMMIMLGVNLLEVLPTHLMSIKPPKWLSHKIHDLSESEHPAVPVLLGAATFFLPCGFTQSMQLYAMSLGDPMQAAIVMGVFALGTMPALLGVGALTASAKGGMLKKMGKVAGAIVLVLGIANFQNGAAIMGWQLPESTSAYSAVEIAKISGGTQFIQTEITKDFTYSPDVLRVVEGIPVIWEVFGTPGMGCADTLILRQLGISTRLKPGFNTIKFTPQKTGVFTFSCSMGMIRGTMVVSSQEG